MASTVARLPSGCGGSIGLPSNAMPMKYSPRAIFFDYTSTTAAFSHLQEKAASSVERTGQWQSLPSLLRTRHFADAYQFIRSTSE